MVDSTKLRQVIGVVPEPHPSREVTRFGAFELDVRTGELRKHGHRIRLQDQPFHVLQILLAHHGEVVTREELQRQIWPCDTFVDFDRGLNNAVKRLREALGDSAESPRYVETLPKRGYRFIGTTNPSPAVSEIVPEIVPNVSRAAEQTKVRTSSGLWRRWIVLVPFAALLAVIGFHAIQSWSDASSASPIRSLAILPLVNLSGDPKQEYFADGMTEELIAELGQVSTLRTISRTSVMAYKGTKKTVPVIARELHVDGILEGSIEREGNKVRVIVQLIDSRTDEHIWAHSYERDMTSALELQSDVARAITDQVRIELTPHQQAQLKRIRRAEPATLELHLQGMQLLNSGNPRAAIELFRQALARAPDYAPAHAAMSSAYGWMGEAGWISYAEAFAQQKAAALKAIELDDSRPEPHLELGFAAMNQGWDWTTQNKEFRRALELNPNSAAVRWAHANYLNRMGLADDAVAEAKLALQLDPVSSRSHMNLSFIYYYARQYDEALAQIERAIALHPDPLETTFPLSIIYVETRQYDQAILEFQKLGDVPHGLGHLGNAYARRGLKAEARAVVLKLKEHVHKTGIGRYEIALVYAGLRDNDKAFEWLESAYQVRDKGLTYLKVDPCLDPLRTDQRFAPLVLRVGIPTS
jgi:TolB-like protein/DNA-binding winged helix-turn-helix (wHTH) protein/Tfp pilus assembly protein PilF